MSRTRSNINPSDVRLRSMLTTDLSVVLTIERSAQANPWSRLSFEESLNQDYQCRVVCVGDEVVGYHICSSVLDEQHVLNLAIAPTQQGYGLAHYLMQDIVELASANAAMKIFLEVRASNTVAQTLYKQWQFDQIALRKQYYSPSDARNPVREDAYVFVRTIGAE